MNISRREWLRKSFRLAMAVIALLVKSSAMAAESADAKAIQGKWRMVHTNESEAVGTPERKESIVMEFRADGVLLLIQDGEKHTHHYRYTDGGKLEIILKSGSLEKRVEFVGKDRMRLTQDREGVAFLKPIVEEYRRVK